MEINNHINRMKAIEEQVLNYIDDENSSEQELKSIFDLNIIDNLEMEEIINLLTKIVNNYHHTESFPQKIMSIIIYLKEYLMKNYSNHEIFNLFKDSSYLLFILMNEKILTPTESIFNNISKEKYIRKNYLFYLYPEFSSFFAPNSKKKHYKVVSQFLKEGEEKFNNLRKEGQNHSYICKLIRDDSVEEFITHVNRTNLSLNSNITSSIFETNKFLLKNKPTLIEYAAFYGSIQILRYLSFNNVKLQPSLWLYAIHGNNPELIHFIEENNVTPKNKSYKKYIHEALKCHNYDISNYLMNLYVKLQYEEEINYIDKLLKYGCYQLFNEDFIENSLQSMKCEIIEYNYVKLFDILFKLKMIDINEITISNFFFLIQFHNFDVF